MSNVENSSSDVNSLNGNAEEISESDTRAQLAAVLQQGRRREKAEDVRVAADERPRNVPPNVTEKRGFGGSADELSALRAVLWNIGRSPSALMFVANDLVSFFGPDQRGAGFALFNEWATSPDVGTPKERGCDENPAEIWMRAKDHAPKPLLTLTETLRALRATKRTLGVTWCWPEVVKDKEGKETTTPVHKSQANIELFLKLTDVTVFLDEFARRYYIREFKQFDELNDDAVEALWLEADRIGLKPPLDFFEKVVRNIARQNARHPVREYFANVETRWDGKKRLGNWLTQYMGASPTALNAAIGQLLLVAAVRRVRCPGAKYDSLVVFIGPQGAGKSTALKVLMPVPSWFDDALSLGADTKTVIEQTTGKLIVEISELRGSGREVESQKAMLSRSADTARLSYRRTAETVPRQFIVVGTTNNSEFLIDHTGNRRFLPVEVGKVDLEALRRDRDQLWAEAAALEASGEITDLALPEQLWGAAAEAQRDRELTDPIFDAIAAELGDTGGSISMGVLYAIIGLGSDKRDRREQRHQQAIGRAMTRLGWKRERVRVTGSRQYVYRKSAPHELSYLLNRNEEVTTMPIGIVGVRAQDAPNVARMPTERRRRPAEGVTGAPPRTVPRFGDTAQPRDT